MGKKKNAPAGAAAGTSSSKVIDNLKTLNSDLVNEVAELRKQIEQLRSQPDSLTTDRDIADRIERDVSSTIGEAEINTCNSFSCDSFTPNNSTRPKLWTGWFKAWDKPDPHRLAEDLAYSVARFFQSSGTLQNYYMYHGGTSFGRATGPYIITTYDYEAPIDEYGNIGQPKWGNLKNLHAVIKKMEKALTYGNAKAAELGSGLSETKFFDIGVVPGCFLANKNTTDDATLDFEGTKYFLPAWSVSILPDCKEEVYNTAKINAQTSITVKKPNQAEAEPTSLIWSWKPEDLSKAVQGLETDFTTNTLRDQILASVDASDYLWYITSVNGSQDEQMSVQVNTAGHILHAFVNGDLIGSEYAPNGKSSFVFEKDVVLNQEMNIISLLSATVGLKVGLDGEKQQVYLDNSNSSWNTGGIFPKKVPFTWCKTTFQAPLGSDPVVVDLLGMGKGTAWFNGQSFGRFWPSYLTWVGGCSPCDYRGPFQSNSCQTGCSEPAQRWYYVPRSFVRAVEPNTLVLFEEVGGDPSQVNFQTVIVGIVCANVVEGNILTLSCQGPQKISAIQVTSFGDPQGTCGSFQIGSCNVDSAFGIVRQLYIIKYWGEIAMD